MLLNYSERALFKKYAEVIICDFFPPSVVKDILVFILNGRILFLFVWGEIQMVVYLLMVWLTGDSLCMDTRRDFRQCSYRLKSAYVAEGSILTCLQITGRKISNSYDFPDS